MTTSGAAEDIDPGRRNSEPADYPPHWELQTDESGSLVATLTGTYPPLTVTAPDLPTLRKLIKIRIMRGML
jgi:hypothetical protein